MMWRTLLLSVGLWMTPAFAADPPHEGPPAGEHGTEPVTGEHGTQPHDGEGTPAHEGGAHNVDYLGDVNANGVPDWRDPKAPDAFVITGLLQHAINLAILLAALVWFFRRPVIDALANRALVIQRELGEAARLRAEAEARQVELAARIQAFEGEVEKMKAQALVDAKAEEARLIARAHEESIRIAATAERNIRDEVARARTSLQADAVELAMKLAENTLRTNVKSEDQQALARQFLDSLNAGVANGR